MARISARQSLACFTLLIGVMALPAQASPIVYNVNDSIGGTSISGTLTTDGTIGTGLGSSIFTDFALTVTNGGMPTLFTPMNAFVSPGNTRLVTATPTALSLDINGQFVILSPPPGDGGKYVWQIEDVPQSSRHQIQDPFRNYGVSDSRVTTTFAVAPAIAAGVPEPKTWALLASGMVGIGLTRRRRAQHPG